MRMIYTNTASALVHTGHITISKLVVTSGSDAATVDFYDNTSAAGTKVASLKVAAASTDEIDFSDLVCVNGLYANIVAGTTPAYFIYSQ